MSDRQYVICGDCREELARLPDGQAALAILDGPYNLRKAEWDKFDSWEEFRAFYRPVFAELSRVLRDNCSLYVFGTFESLAALKPELDGLGRGWRFLNHISWVNEPMVGKFRDAGTRTWLPAHREQCLFYARDFAYPEALSEDGGRIDHTLCKYLRAEQRRAGLTNAEIDEACGWRTKAFHFFATSASNWCMPTRANYLALRRCFNERSQRNGEYLCREYEYLRREYGDLRAELERLRYPFNPQIGVTDVWEFPICAGKERVKVNGQTAHVAQKPVALMKRIVAASSNEGDLVLDPMCGTGTVGVACKRLDRQFIGIELSEEYAAIARARIEAAEPVAEPQAKQTELALTGGA